VCPRVAEVDQKVKVGDIILRIGLQYLEEHAKSPLSPIVTSDLENCRVVKHSGEVIQGQTIVFSVVRE
jgi:phosphotransferase system IIA component